jgi:cation/acetate symporter
VKYDFSWPAFAVFAFFVGIVLGLSFWLGRKAKSAKGYYAAHGQIHWFVNGIAFAGDYLSAASFLGICGMIAFFGYDGFLYSIGYLAGWIVALFVIAEPLKRRGKFTFADALDSTFNSRGIKLTAAISTLIVSIFYLIPQMVGAGSLIQPLLGFGDTPLGTEILGISKITAFAWGVLMVGTIVTMIVVTAGMVSTTWVQFIKGSMLVLFCFVLVIMILNRGLNVAPTAATAGAGGNPIRNETLAHLREQKMVELKPSGGWDLKPYVRFAATEMPADGQPQLVRTWRMKLPADFNPDKIMADKSVPESERKAKVIQGLNNLRANGATVVSETQVVRERFIPKVESATEANGVITRKISFTTQKAKEINGVLQGHGTGEADLYPVGTVSKLPGEKQSTGALSPVEFIATLQNSKVVSWRSDTVNAGLRDGLPATAGSTAPCTVYYPVELAGTDLMQAGGTPTFAGIRSEKIADKLDFISLMIALFCGTASLPHILIRYYTVKDGNAARKSTVAGIASIGFFYVLTLFLGLGAMTSGGMDPTNNNMAAPLLAKTFGELPFAIVSAIAFTTVLGTVSGLIMAASGAVAHDLMTNVLRMKLDDHGKVRAGKMVAVVVGIIAMVLGILFQKLNVTFLVGWAFNVAASANLPSLIMLLFWRKTTKQGITVAITVGLLASLGWILLSAQAFKDVYSLDPANAIVPFSQPGLVTIPLGFVVLILVSLVTQPKIAKGTGFPVAA